MADNPNNKTIKLLIIIAVIVVILAIAYAIYHYSGLMKMFNPYISGYTKELVK